MELGQHAADATYRSGRDGEEATEHDAHAVVMACGPRHLEELALEGNRSQPNDAWLADLYTYIHTPHTAGRAQFDRTMAPPAVVSPSSSTLAAAAAPAPTTSAALAAAGNRNGNGNGNSSHDGAKPPVVLKQPFIATRLNNVLHLPYVYDLSWCVRVFIYVCYVLEFGVWSHPRSNPLDCWTWGMDRPRPGCMTWTDGSVGAPMNAALAYFVSAPVIPHRPPAPQNVQHSDPPQPTTTQVHDLGVQPPRHAPPRPLRAGLHVSQ